MDKCELCAEGGVTHPDDMVRVVVHGKNYARPMYLCPGCLRDLQQCSYCRWFNEDTKKCFESPYTVTKEQDDGCGRWKQDEPLIVLENEREEVADGSPRFSLA